MSPSPARLPSPGGPPTMALHGGAGDPARIDTVQEAHRRAVLREALDLGTALLDRGADALEACIAAVCLLEDSPLFNAGRGSVLDRDGGVSLDASLMWGADRSAGAVGGLTRVQNPVRAAALVRAHTPHVQLTGPAALALAVEHGLPLQEPDWFRTAARRAQLAAAQGRIQLDHAGEGATPKDHENTDLEGNLENHTKGTVGAVARDRHGHVAAATSTGGMTAKWPGRIGDSAVIGAGTYAWDRTCAVSATGHGERFIEAHVAGRISDWMDMGGLSLGEAARRVVLEELDGFGAGGVIAVCARTGALALPFNTQGMYRAARHRDGRVEVGGFGD